MVRVRSDARHVVEVEVAAVEAELAADRLWSLGVTAVEERAAPAAGRVVLAAGVDAADVDRVAAGLAGAWPVRVVEVDDAGWADGWKRWATDVRVGERLHLHPAWLPDPSPAPDEDAVVVRLDPGRAFGSGTHPTTRMVLTALERRLRPGDSVLDVGSGSGVLSIAAALLGAGSVMALDIDAEAERATRENAERNDVARRVHTLVGTVAAVRGTYDLLLVNIAASAIVGAGPDMAARGAPDGVIVASGFFSEHADAVATA